ncbi:stage III sporulation protein AA [Paenibacillaceae bacterium GAS479]|nr:stage III sporulation protein AA [Paenibacillaceae bacterium GAS479]
MLKVIAHLLPPELYERISLLPHSLQTGLEEVRVREERPLELVSLGKSGFLTDRGDWSDAPQQAFKPSAELCRKLLGRLTGHSLYAMEEELKKGYITVTGGHRVGLAGRTVLEHGEVKAIRDIGGFNIRIAREAVGAADRLAPQLADSSRRTILSTLIIGPPRMGKTTMLRDLARIVSSGAWKDPAQAGWPGRRVAIVDERSEIAASVKGVPSFDVGPRTDVMDACPKAEGMMMMLRSMSPEVIMADEIGRTEDAVAVREAAHAGVAVVATAHASSLEEAKGRPILRELLMEGTFSRCVILSRGNSGFMAQAIALRHSQPTAREPTADFAVGGGGP